MVPHSEGWGKGLWPRRQHARRSSHLSFFVRISFSCDCFFLLRRVVGKFLLGPASQSLQTLSRLRTFRSAR